MVPNTPEFDHHEQHGKVKGESGELAALREAGDPAEQRGPPADRILADIGEKRRREGRATWTSSSGSMSKRSPYMLAVTCLASKAAAANEPDRSLRQVVAQIEDDGGRNRTEAEGHAPDHFVREVGDDEDGDDHERQHLTHREHELPPIAHDLAFPAGQGSMM